MMSRAFGSFRFYVQLLGIIFNIKLNSENSNNESLPMNSKLTKAPIPPLKNQKSRENIKILIFLCDGFPLIITMLMLLKAVSKDALLH